MVIIVKVSENFNRIWHRKWNLSVCRMARIAQRILTKLRGTGIFIKQKNSILFCFGQIVPMNVISGIVLDTV